MGSRVSIAHRFQLFFLSSMNLHLVKFNHRELNIRWLGKQIEAINM